MCLLSAAKQNFPPLVPDYCPVWTPWTLQGMDGFSQRGHKCTGDLAACCGHPRTRWYTSIFPSLCSVAWIVCVSQTVWTENKLNFFPPFVCGSVHAFFFFFFRILLYFLSPLQASMQCCDSTRSEDGQGNEAEEWWDAVRTGYDLLPLRHAFCCRLSGCVVVCSLPVCV